MACKCQIIIDIMDRFAPPALTETWDNTGLLLGSREQDIEKVMLCLDITDVVVREAIEKRVDLIISHHPFIFHPLKAVIQDVASGSLLYSLIKHDIAVFAAHTNLDATDGGVNDVLAELLGLQVIGALTETGLGRVGMLPETLVLSEFCRKVQKALDYDRLRLVGEPNRKISKIAICGGSGADLINCAIQAGADVYLTGDIKHHDAVDARLAGIAIVDASHFATERPVLQKLIDHLQKELIDLQYKIEVFKSSAVDDPFLYTWE